VSGFRHSGLGYPLSILRFAPPDAKPGAEVASAPMIVTMDFAVSLMPPPYRDRELLIRWYYD
jgi:hypothetical protein